MSFDQYKQIAAELEVMFDSPIPMNPTREECLKVEQMLNTLRSMNAKQIGVNSEELEGVIGIADLRFRELVRAKH